MISVPLRQENAFVGSFGTEMDATEQGRLAEILRVSERYLSEGVRLAHMGSWAFNATGFNYWSSDLLRVHGLDPRGKPPKLQHFRTAILVHNNCSHLGPRCRK